MRARFLHLIADDSQTSIRRVSPVLEEKDKDGKRKNLGTFSTREKAAQHEKAVQYFKRAG
jgi:hypothetical protein